MLVAVLYVQGWSSSRFSGQYGRGRCQRWHDAHLLALEQVHQPGQQREQKPQPGLLRARPP